MKNAIYEGSVVHSRLTPKRHKFNYKVCYYFFDLNRPEELITVPGLISFNPKNYLSSSQIQEYLSKEFGPKINSEIQKVFILTQLSYFGFCFNPVSFYYCYSDDDQLLYLVSQITNTPWGEKSTKCFDFKTTKGQMYFPKDFHVSPFMPMEIDYSWKFNSPQENIDIFMSNRIQDQKDSFFYAHLRLRSMVLNRKNVFFTFINYPLMSFKTIVGIYWQALILYLKQVPFYTHPDKKEVA